MDSYCLPFILQQSNRSPGASEMTEASKYFYCKINLPTISALHIQFLEFTVKADLLYWILICTLKYLY